MVDLYQHEPSVGQTQVSSPSPRLGASLHIFMGARQTQPEPHRNDGAARGGGVPGSKGTGSRGGTGRAGVGPRCWSLTVAGAWQGQEHEAAQPRDLQTWGKPQGTKHVRKIFFP